MTNEFEVLRWKIQQEKKLIRELVKVKEGLTKADGAERKMFSMHLTSVKKKIKQVSEDINTELQKISIAKPFSPEKTKEESKKETEKGRKEKWTGKRPVALEREYLRRIKKKEEKLISKKPKKPSRYVELAHKIFENTSERLSDSEIFRSLKTDLIKANMQFLPKIYVSVILFTTAASVIAAAFIFLFFLFFNIVAEFPIIIPITESIGQRFLKTFWILFAVPTGTFLLMYTYPAMEKKAAENRIEQELPFATIHMSAISESMVEPSNIFRIIVATKEYPYLRREFIKLINEVNIYGYDLVSALRRSAFNSPSKKLAELFNGLATTITSGGDLPEFFEKRSQSLLFEYRLEREKNIRTAETFMDIYISVVIAAPMILMLLLMIIKISGLGIELSMGMISLIMVLGVGMINIIFLTFLHLKQPRG